MLEQGPQSARSQIGRISIKGETLEKQEPMGIVKILETGGCPCFAVMPVDAQCQYVSPGITGLESSMELLSLRLVVDGQNHSARFHEGL